MKRPSIYSFFIGFNTLVAVYELLLFPTFTQTEQFDQLIPLILVHPTTFILFGITKGLYSLVMVYGLMTRKKWVYYGLLGGNASLIIASLLLSNSLSLAPFAILMIALYAYYFRSEDVQKYLTEPTSPPSSPGDKPTNAPSESSEMTTKSSPSFSSFPFLFYGLMGLSGYFLFSALSVLITISLSNLSMFAYVVGFLVIYIVLFLVGMRVRPNKALSWHSFAGKQLLVVGALGVFFGFVLTSAGSQPEMVEILQQSNSAISPSMGIWLMVYGAFLGFIGYPLLKSSQEDSES